ncbi:MAG TPA: hypothetical protein VMI33_25655 [Streptosporangiaceae bacterium]|nr:hypothetical protein [Streptosporangiaceae bacterium]
MSAIRYQVPDPALVLPFTCRGDAGTVAVHYGVTADPAGVGFDIVASGSGFDEARFRGFPVVRAEVSFGGAGYRAFFGWLQIISRSVAESGAADVTADVTVDLPPMLAEADSPLAGFGYLPTLFDAPANPDHPDGQWIAETFLTAGPYIARTRRLASLTGFRWGYRLAAGRPAPLPPSPIGPDRWAAHCPRLAAAYPNWTFLASAW